MVNSTIDNVSAVNTIDVNQDKRRLLFPWSSLKFLKERKFVEFYKSPRLTVKVILMAFKLP